MAQENQLRAENAKLKGQLSKAIGDVHYWRERAIYLEAERTYYHDQVRED